jgi:cytochrome c-type protein NapB
VPVAPHPELVACLECHVGDERLLPTPLPGADPSARCRQCHSTGGMLWKDSAINWKPLPWPQVQPVTAQNAVPPIPHSLELRGNCLACHSAPAAVLEIRTKHPERANCRQCHVEARNDPGEFVRPQPATARNQGSQ